MSGTRKWIVAAVGASLLALLVAGAALAQPAPTPEANQNGASYGQYFLDQLAKALNINRDQLNAAIKTAGAQTVDKEAQDGRLTADQVSQLKQKIEQGNGLFPGFGRGFDFRGPGKVAPRGAFLGGNGYTEGVAKALGLSTDELRTELRSGKTVADLAKEKNVSAEAIKSAVVTAVGAQLDQTVAAGKMTADQAAKIKSQLENTAADQFLTMRGMGKELMPFQKLVPPGERPQKQAPAAPRTSGPTT